MEKRYSGKIALFSLVFLLFISIIGSSFVKSAKKENIQKITIYLAGDSTVSDYSSSLSPRAGWGQVLEKHFDNQVVVINEATPGRSSKSFIDEGRLKLILNQIEKGDYLFIQFGHNDEKIKDPSRYTEPNSTYKNYLKQYIDAARAKQAIPVLVTPVERRYFTEKGVLSSTHGEYPAAMKELGLEEHVPVIDLTAKSHALFQKLGPEKTKDVFLWLDAQDNMNYPNGVQDNTHFQENGAKKIARMVVDGIEESMLVPLSNHILKK